MAGDVGSLWQVDLGDVLANQFGKTGSVGPCVCCWAERLPQPHGEASLRLEGQFSENDHDMEGFLKSQYVLPRS